MCSDIFAVCRHSVVGVLCYGEVTGFSCECIFHLYGIGHISADATHLHYLYLVELAWRVGVYLSAHVFTAYLYERDVNSCVHV